MIEKLKKQSDELESLLDSGLFTEYVFKGIELTIDTSKEFLFALGGISSTTAPIIIAACEATVNAMKEELCAKIGKETYKAVLDAAESCRQLAQKETTIAAIKPEGGHPQ